MQHLKSLTAQMAVRTPSRLPFADEVDTAPAAIGLQPDIVATLSKSAVQIGLTLTTRLGQTPMPKGATGPSGGTPQRG